MSAPTIQTESCSSSTTRSNPPNVAFFITLPSAGSMIKTLSPNIFPEEFKQYMLPVTEMSTDCMSLSKENINFPSLSYLDILFKTFSQTINEPSFATATLLCPPTVWQMQNSSLLTIGSSLPPM